MSGKGKDVVDVPAPATSVRNRKPKQEHLPGQEPQAKIAAVHHAIEAYVEVRDQRMQLTEVEVQKRTLLGEIMKKHGLTKYAVDGHIAEIEAEEKIKAKLKDEEDEPEVVDDPRELRPKNHLDLAVNPPKKARKRGRDAAAGAD